MTATPRLRVEVDAPGGARSTRDVVVDGPVWVGRGEGCPVVLDSPLVSRRHVAIEVVDERLAVTDGSVNGTVLDGELLRGERRVAGEVARLGIGPFAVRASLLPGPVGAAVGPLEEQDLRRRARRELLEAVRLPAAGAGAAGTPSRQEVTRALERILATPGTLPAERAARLVEELCDEALGLGPLEPLLSDAEVTEVMVVDPATIYVERRGRLERTPARFTDADSVRSVIERIVTPLGRRIDESSPMVDARLPDGSRVNAIIPPLAVRGPCITIRKFHRGPSSLDALVRLGALPVEVARFLAGAVRGRRSIVVSGGTGSGKTTLLNALSAAIPDGERIITIEDAAELHLAQPHVVALESRPSNHEGRGGATIRDLVRNALRMRPDRIIVGECRGGEAFDMLQAMNTGHEGSMTTTHANGPREALLRLESLCLMSGVELPVAVVRAQVAASVELVVQVARFPDGARRIVAVAEVAGLAPDAGVRLRTRYALRQRYAVSGATGEES